MRETAPLLFVVAIAIAGSLTLFLSSYRRPPSPAVSSLSTIELSAWRRDIPIVYDLTEHAPDAEGVADVIARSPFDLTITAQLRPDGTTRFLIDIQSGYWTAPTPVVLRVSGVRVRLCDTPSALLFLQKQTTGTILRGPGCERQPIGEEWIPGDDYFLVTQPVGDESKITMSLDVDGDYLRSENGRSTVATPRIVGREAGLVPVRQGNARFTAPITDDRTSNQDFSTPSDELAEKMNLIMLTAGETRTDESGTGWRILPVHLQVEAPSLLGSKASSVSSDPPPANQDPLAWVAPSRDFRADPSAIRDLGSYDSPTVSSIDTSTGEGQALRQEYVAAAFRVLDNNSLRVSAEVTDSRSEERGQYLLFAAGLLGGAAASACIAVLQVLTRHLAGSCPEEPDPVRHVRKSAVFWFAIAVLVAVGWRKRTSR